MYHYFDQQSGAILSFSESVLYFSIPSRDTEGMTLERREFTRMNSLTSLKKLVSEFVSVDNSDEFYNRPQVRKVYYPFCRMIASFLNHICR